MKAKQKAAKAPKATKSKASKAGRAGKAVQAPEPAPTTAKPRKGQLKLPAEGMARTSTSPKIDAAAEDYRKKRDTRMEWTKLEKDAKAELLKIAKAEGVGLYIYEGPDGEFEVEYTQKSEEDIAVRKHKVDEE